MKKTVSSVVSGQVLEKIGPKTLIGEALGRMETKRISSLLVFEGDEFLGIVTMTDIAKAFGKGAGTVASIMTPALKVVFVDVDDDLKVCGTTMRAHHFHHLVVRDRNNMVMGIISSLDLEE